jgi:hypothetical protein
MLHTVAPPSSARQRARRLTDAAADGVNAALGRARAAADNERMKKAGARASAARQTVAKKIPTVVRDGAETAGLWVHSAIDGGVGALNRAGTFHLSPARVVKAHRKRGHEVAALHDLRHLDLESIDKVKPRHLDARYEFLSAVSGAAAGVAITGTEVVGGVLTVSTSGAASAPTFGTVSAAVSVDTALTLSLSAGVVGHTALHYGYDVARPEERLFVLSVINLGSAATSGAKLAAYRDVARLSQALARKATWQVLNQSPVTQLATKFAEAFATRLTKPALAKAVPFVGIGVGAVLNWYTLEWIADAADFAYRRRFLLEKYPDLAELSGGRVPFLVPFETGAADRGADDGDTTAGGADAAGGDDIEISVVDTAIAEGLLDPADVPDVEGQR